MDYQHTQSGKTILLSMGGGILFCLYVYLRCGHCWAGTDVFVFSLLFLVLFLFSSLTVLVEPGKVLLKYGPGLIRKTINLKDIISCQVVSNPWYYGWGIKRIPGGWLYSVDGLEAVELKMKDGSVVRIGSDQPKELKQAIDLNLAQKNDLDFFDQQGTIS